MERKEGIKVLKLYLKVADAFYNIQKIKGIKFTKGRLRFRKDVKKAITLAITELLKKREDPFKWMESWLKAYQEANNNIDTKKIMDWIFEQPMTCGTEKGNI